MRQHCDPLRAASCLIRLEQKNMSNQRTALLLSDNPITFLNKLLVQSYLAQPAAFYQPPQTTETTAPTAPPTAECAIPQLR